MNSCLKITLNSCYSSYFSDFCLKKLLIQNRNIIGKLRASRTFSNSSSLSSEIESSEEGTSANKVGSFASAFKKFSEPVKEQKPPQESFATLLRNSKFIDLGNPKGKKVIGKIFHVVNDDLYIDFGWKFHCVCTRPATNASDYVKGAEVLIKIKDLELSTRFLGHEKDLTLLEADAILLGIVSTPSKIVPQEL